MFGLREIRTVVVVQHVLLRREVDRRSRVVEHFDPFPTRGPADAGSYMISVIRSPGGEIPPGTTARVAAVRAVDRHRFELRLRADLGLQHVRLARHPICTAR